MFEGGSVQEHGPNHKQHLAAAGDQGGFSRKPAFLLPVDEFLYSVRPPLGAAAEDGEVEVFPEEGVPLPGDPEVEPARPSGLADRGVEPGVGGDLPLIREPRDVAYLGQDRGREPLPDPVDAGQDPEPARLPGLLDQPGSELSLEAHGRFGLVGGILKLNYASDKIGLFWM